MQLFGLFICTQSALHISSDVFAHHQEHLIVFTASDIVHLCCWRPVSWTRWNSVPPRPWHHPPLPILIYLHKSPWTAMAQWLRCCATNRKVAGSIPGGVIGIFRRHNPSDRTMALGSILPLTEMSTSRISGGKCGRCVRLTTLPPSCAVVMKSGNLNFLEPCGPLQACNGTALPLSANTAHLPSTIYISA